MKFMARYAFFIPAAAGILGCALALAAPAGLAHAQTLDPFESDSSQWKSFDRYKEEEKDRLFSTMTGNPDADARAMAEQEAADKKAAEDAPPRELKIPVATPEGGALPATPPAMNADGTAAPERPLALPVMPGVNGGFDVRVGSTEDDAKPAARLVNIDTQPNLQLQKQDWLDAMQAAKDQAQGRDMEDHTPLHVRMSFLPGVEVPMTKIHPAAAVKPLVTALPPAPKPADAAACAAIDAYKKHQLEAIQSDRETLAALQSAIKDLGLEQKLDFMGGADGKVTASGDKPTALMDMPASLPSTLPPVGKP